MATSDEYPASTRAWCLQHVVDAIISHAHSIDRDRKWTRLLSLNRTTFHSAVQYAWTSIDLSRYPWDCPSKERLDCYRRSLKRISLASSLPLVHKWTIPSLLEHFPKVKVVTLPTVSSVGQAIEVFRNESGKVTKLECIRAAADTYILGEHGIIVQEPSFSLPLQNPLWCSRDQEPDPEPVIHLAPTTRSARDAFRREVQQNGLLNQPQFLHEYIFHLNLDPTHPFEAWLELFRLRGQQGIATTGVHWGLKWVSPDQLLRLGQACPALERLDLGVEPGDLNQLFGSIFTSTKFPCLTEVDLYLNALSSDGGYLDGLPVPPITEDALSMFSSFIPDEEDLDIKLNFVVFTSGTDFEEGDLFGSLCNNVQFEALEVLYAVFSDRMRISFESSDPAINGAELKKEVSHRVKSFVPHKQDQHYEQSPKWMQAET